MSIIGIKLLYCSANIDCSLKKEFESSYVQRERERERCEKRERDVQREREMCRERNFH